MTTVRSLFQWIGHPFKVIGNFLRALVNLSQTQMRAIFSLGMLGGIIALSFQNLGLIFMVDQRLKDAARGSLFGQMALNQQWWNNAIMGGFACIVGLVVWGADYLKAKYADVELETGKGRMKAKGAAAPEAAPPADPPKDPDQPTLEDAP